MGIKNLIFCYSRMRIIWYKLSDMHLSSIEPMNSMGLEPLSDMHLSSIEPINSMGLEPPHKITQLKVKD